MNNTLVINYSSQSASVDELLRYAQLIADAFSKALDQNECNVKVLIAVRQQIKDDRDTLKDLNNMLSNKHKPLYQKPLIQVHQTDKQIKYPLKVTTVPPEVTKEILKRLKEKCYHCDFDFPKISFHNNLKFSFDRLKLHIQLYKDAFKALNPNFCHVSGALNWSCLQDLIKLITLLLSAYSAVLALRKISGISLNMFIKGVISGLLGQLVGNLRLQIDLSQTGLSCLIKVFEEIANNIPDGSTIHSKIPPGLLEDLGMIIEDRSASSEELLMANRERTYEHKLRLPEYKVVLDDNGSPRYEFSGWVDAGPENYDTWADLQTLVKDGTLPPDHKGLHHDHSHETDIGSSSSYVLKKFNIDRRDSIPPNDHFGMSGYPTPNYFKPKNSIVNNKYYQATLRNFNDPKGINFMKKFTQQFKQDVNYYEQTVSNAFKYVNDTIEQAIADFNTNISQIFGLIDYFQCEAERTGPGFMELLDLLNRLSVVINLLSSIIAVVARRQIEKMCKTKGDITDVSDILSYPTEFRGADGYNDLYPLDVVNEFLGKVVVNTTNGNGQIAPIIYNKPVKPLLPKLSFHNCNLNDFIDAHKPSNIINTIVNDIVNNPQRPKGPFSEDDDAFLVTGDPKHKGIPLKDVIDKEKWSQYDTQFVPAPIVKDDWILLDKNGNLTDIGLNQDKGYGVKDILDLIYNNPLPESDKDTNKGNPSSTDTSFRTKIETPFYSDSKDKYEFENKCRDINDVLDIVESLRGIKK